VTAGPGLVGVNPTDAVKALGARVSDSRPRVATGVETFDRRLNRGGFAPGELVILAGRTGTRKTTVALNLVTSMLGRGLRVGFIGLDETPASYTAKLASALFDRPTAAVEEDIPEWAPEYKRRTKNLTLSLGYRPTMDDLTHWKKMAEFDGPPLQVVFLDYISLLERDRYAGQEVQRISRLVEELQVWTNENDVVLIALHQVGRFDEGSGGRYHGESPLSLEGLKYGGEEIADVVMATYRPALDPVGRMTLEDAFGYFPDGWKDDKVRDAWDRARRRVLKYQDSTFLQLLKNRPGEQPDGDAFRGVELVSPGASMVMQEKASRVGDDMKHSVGASGGKPLAGPWTGAQPAPTPTDDPVSAAERVIARAAGEE
jgi:archaellum biogenesis ATPase FlaH